MATDGDTPPEPPSSPSSGASISGQMREPHDQNVPPILPLEAVRALAMAGEALIAIANALKGQTASNVATLSKTLPFEDATTIVEATNELLKQKVRAGRNDDYLRNLRTHLKKFAQSMDNAAIRDVTATKIEKWLDRLDVNDRTRKGHLDSVRLLFNFARRRGYVRENPAADIELPEDASRLRPPRIHTPAEVARVLHSLRTADPDVCRFLAVRYFTGLRASEAQRCVIQLERGFVEVPAIVAKTRRRRLVPIRPALAAWLQLEGKLPVRNLNTRIAAVAKLSGVEWSPNVTRHSFCSYHLAAFQNAGKTALEAGHSEQMLFEHYREIVTPAEAAQFWELTPERCASLCAHL